MRPRTAALLLRLPRKPDFQWRRQALDTVLRETGSGTPVAMRAVARALSSQGHETVWRAWLRPSVSGPSPQRWASPVVAELVRGSPPVPRRAVDAGWRDWLDEHDAALWSLLERWDRLATADPGNRSLSALALGNKDVAVGAHTLAQAAARFDHPIGERARARLVARDDIKAVDLFCAKSVGFPDAVAFCIAHHLAPSDDVQRAMFFVRTGQDEQYRALDPDGALLALGYRSGPTEVRASLRTAMTALGGIDALRILAGQRSQQDDPGSLTEPERAYLVRQLADQGDWERLWPLIVSLPLDEAVNAACTFGDWRPSAEDDRRVFERLRRAEPSAVSRDVQSISAASVNWTTPHRTISLADLDERVTSIDELDFAPDGGQLAFSSLEKYAGIIDLDSGTLMQRYFDFEYHLTGVANLGSNAMAVIESDLYFGHRATSDPPSRIHYLDHDSGRRISSEVDGSYVLTLHRSTGDQRFIALARQDDAESREFRLLVGGADAALVDSGVLADQTLWSAWAAVDPRGRLVAVDDGRTTVIADLEGPVVRVLVGHEPLLGGSHPWIAVSPSALLSASHQGDVRIWREPLTSAQEAISGHLRLDGRLIDLAWSPALDRFLAISLRDERTGPLPLSMYRPSLQVLDVPATHDRPLPQDLVSDSIELGLVDDPTPCVRLSPKGDVLAVVKGSATIDFYSVSLLKLRRIIGRPMSLMTHTDLADVVAFLENPVRDVRFRQTLELLRACLEYRYRHDIGIGDAEKAVAASEYDIELGG
jgi:WD40 repeat protein